MSMAACIKCNNGICTCGLCYRKYTKNARISLAAVVLGIEREDVVKMLCDIVPDKHPYDE